MSDGSEWFAPRRYGYGAGLPISWQGWVVSLFYAGAVVGAALLLRNNKLQMIAAFIPLTAAFLVIAAKTTRGGWRWRWGEEE